MYRIIALMLLFLMPLTSYAFPPKKGAKDCKECHKLDKKEAEAIVKKIVPTGTVTDITMAPIKGIWQIDVDAGEGKRGALFLDFAKKFIVAGQIVPVEQLGKQAPKKVSKVDVSKIPLDNALVLGSQTAKHKVIVFTDPDCPYCRELHKTMKQIVAKREDIAFALILNPLPFHKESPRKVQSILCTRSLTVLDDAFSGKAVPDPTCPADAVEQSKELARSLEFSGTPTLVRDDGVVAAGALPENDLLEWIDKKQ